MLICTRVSCCWLANVSLNNFLREYSLCLKSVKFFLFKLTTGSIWPRTIIGCKFQNQFTNVNYKLLSDTLASQQQLTRVQINIGLSRGYLISRSTGKSSELPELDVRKWPLEWPRGLGGGWYTELARTNFIQN
jgi:hypothetical protein